MDLGNKEIPTKVTDYGTVILDTGSSLMILPPVVYDALNQTFHTDYCDLPGDVICGNPSVFEDGCIPLPYNISNFPTLTFIAKGEVKLDVPPSSYFVLVTDPDSGAKAYCLGVVRGESNSHTILGNTFFRSFYVVFDRANSRIGFSGLEGTTSNFTNWWEITFIVLLILALFIMIAAVAYAVWNKKQSYQRLL